MRDEARREVPLGSVDVRRTDDIIEVARIKISDPEMGVNGSSWNRFEFIEDWETGEGMAIDVYSEKPVIVIHYSRYKMCLNVRYDASKDGDDVFSTNLTYLTMKKIDPANKIVDCMEMAREFLLNYGLAEDDGSGTLTSKASRYSQTLPEAEAKRFDYVISCLIFGLSNNENE
jgi:hypothetical protein